MIDRSEKRKRQLAFELQSSRVFEERSKRVLSRLKFFLKKINTYFSQHCFTLYSEPSLSFPQNITLHLGLRLSVCKRPHGQEV